MSVNLLVMQCSRWKRHDKEPLPALFRYDGAVYKTVHKAMREHRCPLDLDIFIVSAKYGLIPAETNIPDYNYPMTYDRARALRGQTSERLDRVLRLRHYDHVFAFLSPMYFSAVSASVELANLGDRLTTPTGLINHRKGELKQWLYDRSSA